MTKTTVSGQLGIIANHSLSDLVFRLTFWQFHYLEMVHFS